DENRPSHKFALLLRSWRVDERYRDVTPIDSLALGYEISLKHAKCAAFSPPSQRRRSFLCRERRVYVLRRTRTARSKADVPRLAWTLLLYSTASKPSRNQRSN